MLVIDDGSTDDVEGTIAPYLADKRIKLAKQTHKGLGSGRNHGVALAQGDYICFLDGDDLFLPHKLETCLQQIEKGQIVYSGMTLIDSEGKELYSFDTGPGYSPENFLAEMLFRNQVIPSTVMARSTCAKTELSVEGMTGMEEYDLFLRWAERYTFTYIPQRLVKYRRHSRAVSLSSQAAVWKEKELIRSYGHERIHEIVWRTTYPESKKRLLYGKILCKIDAYAEALTALQGVELPLVFFYQGNCLLALDRAEEAKQAYLKAIALDPHNAAAYNNLGVAYGRLGRLENAKEQWETAIRIRPGYMDAELNLGGRPEHLPFKVTERELRENLMFYQVK